MVVISACFHLLNLYGCVWTPPILQKLEWASMRTLLFWTMEIGEQVSIQQVGTTPFEVPVCNVNQSCDAQERQLHVICGPMEPYVNVLI